MHTLQNRHNSKSALLKLSQPGHTYFVYLFVSLKRVELLLPSPAICCSMKLLKNAPLSPSYQKYAPCPSRTETEKLLHNLSRYLIAQLRSEAKTWQKYYHYCLWWQHHRLLKMCLEQSGSNLCSFCLSPLVFPCVHTLASKKIRACWGSWMSANRTQHLTGRINHSTLMKQTAYLLKEKAEFHHLKILLCPSGGGINICWNHTKVNGPIFQF